MKNLATVVGLLILSLGTASCSRPAADKQEIRKMCIHLLELRRQPESKAGLDKCIADAEKEGTTRRQALCRIGAVNKTEYWVRCRTGKARK
jgi:hypothetical protein